MTSKKRIAALIAATILGVPVLVISGFFVVLTLDMRRVEAKAEGCMTLIPSIDEFKSRVGRLPSNIEAGQMDPKLVADCGYYNSGEQFSMGLVGQGVNMQVYGYSSETNQWFWD